MAQAFTGPIVLFDGECGLCQRSVNFIIDRDPRARFHFASLQSDIGRKLLAEFAIDPSTTDSVVLIEAGHAYVRSTAALRICRSLRFPYRALSGLIVIPRSMRDMIYNRIAANRRRFFPPGEACRLPTASNAGRFL